MDDGIEANDSRQGRVGNLEGPHIASLKRNVRIQTPRPFDHLCRKVDAAHAHKPILQVARNLAGPAADFTNLALTFHGFGKLVEQFTDKWLSLQFIKKLGDKLIQYTIVTLFVSLFF